MKKSVLILALLLSLPLLSNSRVTRIICDYVTHREGSESTSSEYNAQFIIDTDNMIATLVIENDQSVMYIKEILPDKNGMTTYNCLSRSDSKTSIGVTANSVYFGSKPNSMFIFRIKKIIVE